MPKTIIFDLDGTLVDVVPLFVEIFNTLADDFSYSKITPEEIASIKEKNLGWFLFTKLGLRLWRYREFSEKGQALYLEHLETIEWFPGMPELFFRLKESGYTVGVLSSNSIEAIRKLLAQKNLQADFVATASLSNKATALKNTLLSQKIDPESTLYVGDELRDIRACQKAGIPIIAVTWGLNSKESLIQTGVPTVDSVAELEQMLAQQ